MNGIPGAGKANGVRTLPRVSKFGSEESRGRSADHVAPRPARSKAGRWRGRGGQECPPHTSLLLLPGTLPAPCSGAAPAHGVSGSRAGAGRGLPHSVQQFLQDERIVVLLVLRCEEKRELFLFVCKNVELAQFGLGLRAREFFQIFLAEALPVLGTGVKPFSQFIGRRKITQPFVDGGALLGQSTGPQAV